MNQSFDASDYTLYREEDFSDRWLRPHVLQTKLEKFENHPELDLQIIGHSDENHPIHQIQWGTGAINILCWTQMHGNEPTATMAVIDLLNFLIAKDQYSNYCHWLQQHICLRIIPMLNPDGAEQFSRRNAMQIDPNRDALVQQTAEIKTLLSVVNSFKPHWCFNLHDQRNIFAAGNTSNTATISFLAASPDVERSLNKARSSAMQLIGKMTNVLQQGIPEHIGRYTDEFYPRALGEYFHHRNIPCVLIESGAFKDDPLRDVARKYNFISLIEAFRAIVSGDYGESDVEAYNQIPENHNHMLDVVIRGCEVINNDQIISMDIGLLYEEKPNFETGKLERHLLIQDIGDLSFQHGIIEVEGGRFNGRLSDLRLNTKAHFTLNRIDGTQIQVQNGIFDEKH